jgi:hypothetical protein
MHNESWLCWTLLTAARLRRWNAHQLAAARF